MGKVIKFEKPSESPSKAASVFPPIVGQDELDREALRSSRARYVRNVRVGAFVASLICAGQGMTFLTGLFLGVAFFARFIVNRLKGDLDG